MHNSHLFGRLRRDTGLEHLVGKARIPPIVRGVRYSFIITPRKSQTSRTQQQVRPVELTLVPDSVSTFHDVANALRRCVHLCTTMSVQSSLVKNSYAIRVALIQHLFTHVIPMPLARDHPLRNTRCFWSASDGSRPIRYETQADILRLLDLVSRHYAAASPRFVRHDLCVMQLESLRLRVCATVTDAVIRRIACDVPSQFSLHYSGKAEGPVQAFGFDMRHFALESETLQLTSPGLQACRTQVLDYFSTLVITQTHKNNESNNNAQTQVRFEVKSSRTVTRICCSDSNAPWSSVRVKDVSCQICAFKLDFEGEDGELLPYYLSGEEMTILENYPELGYLRDIVFLFKIMMAPTKETLPGLKRWEPSQARLTWHFRGDSKEESEEEEQKKKKKNKKSKNRFVVGAFDTNDLKCVAYVSDLEEDGSVGGVKSTKNKGILRGAMSAITRFFGHDPPDLHPVKLIRTYFSRVANLFEQRRMFFTFVIFLILRTTGCSVGRIASFLSHRSISSYSFSDAFLCCTSCLSMRLHSLRSQRNITNTQHTGTRKHSSSELSGASGCSRCMLVRTRCVARI